MEIALKCEIQKTNWQDNLLVHGNCHQNDQFKELAQKLQIDTNGEKKLAQKCKIHKNGKKRETK